MSQKRQFKFNLTIYFYNSEDPWFEFEKSLIFNQNLYSISSLVSNHQSEKLCTLQGSMRLSHCDKNNLNLRIKSWACHSWSWWKGTCPFFYNFPAQNFFSLRWRFRSSFTDILQYTQWLCLFSLFSTVRDAGIEPGPGVWSAIPTCHHRSFEPPHLQESINRLENQTNTLASAPTVTDSICVRKFRFFGTVQSSLDNGVKPYCYCTVWKEWASPVQSGLCSLSIPD